uniref:Uncharacterized protein n=1 Tax=Romanomermis culicivorax TaxID=13658 RepID=A0A915I2L4_ROMCU
MKLYDKMGSVAYFANSGHPSTINKFALEIIQETLDENPETMTKELTKVLEDCGRMMSPRLVGCMATGDTANTFIQKTLHYVRIKFSIKSKVN